MERRQKNINISPKILFKSYALFIHHPKTKSTQSITSTGSRAFEGIKRLFIGLLPISSKCSAKHLEAFQFEFNCILFLEAYSNLLHFDLFWLEFVFACGEEFSCFIVDDHRKLFFFFIGG